MIERMTFQQQAKEAIRASGGRITPQRELLLDLLANTDEDIDADHLYRLAGEHDPTISLPTIYRTLNTLESARVIASHYVSREHERKVYRVSGADGTFHFTCRRCGRVTAVKSALIDQLKQELSTQLDAEILTMCMCAGGLCADCRERSQQ